MRAPMHFRFAPKADKRADVSLNPLCARKRRVHRALNALDVPQLWTWTSGGSVGKMAGWSVRTPGDA